MTRTTDTVLHFDQVAITLGGRQILSPVELSVRRGEFVCVIGPSGCGKTTLLRAAAGFVTPSSGSVQRQGKTITGPSREVAFVFQDYGRALLPWRTVQANVSLALEAARMPVAERPARIAHVLKTVGLGAHADKFPAQLSGGMQQRVQIARCLAQQPDVMLMDEPFGALDAMTRATLQDELARLVREEGLTVMFVTHDLEEALYLGGRVIALRSNPTHALPSVAALIDVPLPQPRDQLSTKEHPEFLRLRRELYHYLGHRMKALVLPGVLLGSLELWARTTGQGSDAIAPPSAAVLAFGGALMDGSLLEATAFTLGSAALGLLIGAGVGVLIGTLLGLSRRAAQLGYLSVEVARPIPSVALIPLAMLVFGFGLRMEVSVVAFACLWPMLVLAQAAVLQVEPRLLEVSRALQLSPLQRFVWIVGPAIVPRLFVALRLGVAIALVVAVTVEIAANPHGMG